MRIYLIFSLCFALQLTLLCQTESKDKNYNFKAPDIQITLPDTLREISGFTIIDNETVACVQDENGIIFIYDIKKQKIKRQFKFAENGDYEGITIALNKLYVLRSDGMLFEIENFNSKKPSIKKHITNISCNNNEGLCYLPESNSLLIACKGKSTIQTNKPFNRLIYSFNLTTYKLDPQPFLEIDRAELMIYAQNHNFNFIKKTTKNGKVVEMPFKINPSEIAIHPASNDIYILSATDYCVFIYSKDKQLKHIEPLNKTLFNKAEGLSFSADGDLLISNEGKLKKANLLLFKYKP